jgi:N-acetylneuraminate lyase
MSSSEQAAVALRGVLPAIVTPVNEQGEFASSAFERLLERLYSAGCHGVYVCGQTGEGLEAPSGVRQQAAEAAVRCSPSGKRTIIHVGAARLGEAIQLARHAERIGAQAISSLPPAGNYSFQELRLYYEQLARASGLPLLIYYYPEICRHLTSLDQILDLCSIPQVVGLKFTDLDLFKLHQIKTAGYVIFNGKDEVFAAGLLMGADGGIGSTYNLFPSLFVQIYESATRGRWEEARRIQDQINELVAIVLRFPMPSVIKTMLKWSGIDCGACLAPHRNLSGEETLRLREALQKSRLADSLSLQAIQVR